MGSSSNQNYRWRRNASETCEACTNEDVPAYHSDCFEQHNPLVQQENMGSSMYPFHNQLYKRQQSRTTRKWIFGTVLDPRQKFVRGWNRMFLLLRSLAVAIDPLFLYLLSLSGNLMCIYEDQSFARTVIFLRTAMDIMFLFHIWIQLRLAYVSKKSLVFGPGTLVFDAQKIVLHYLHQREGFLLDLLVILPIPQVLFWAIVPTYIGRGQIKVILMVLLIVFFPQYILKIYHLLCLLRRMQHATGYVFGTIQWGLVLNLGGYIIASHVAGACWYLLATEQVATCLQNQCQFAPGCKNTFLGCPQSMGTHIQKSNDAARLSWAQNTTVSLICLNNDGTQNFHYGIYQSALPLITGNAWLNKILYPIFWGIMTLSSFGNALQPTDHVLEVSFSIIVVTCGLILFTLLIGNFQVLLQSMTSKKEKAKLRGLDLEWWMQRRQMPKQLQQRVRRYERQRWAAMRGIDEMEIVQGFPEGLRRDIKRHLALDLVCQVPLFEQMDDLVLDNICDRLKPLLFIKGETVIREGDPLQRMIFILRGHMQISHRLSNGLINAYMLGPGNFCGDELLSWCLRKPFVERLPPSSATLITCDSDSTEVFALDAYDLKYVTDHFRYTFVNEKVKRTARFYSTSWRTWAAVTIQFAWKRYKARNAKPTTSIAEIYNSDSGPRRLPFSRSLSDRDRLRLYTALFISPKPHDS